MHDLFICVAAATFCRVENTVCQESLRDNSTGELLAERANAECDRSGTAFYYSASPQQALHVVIKSCVIACVQWREHGSSRHDAHL